jgi:hypothetical protein
MILAALHLAITTPTYAPPKASDGHADLSGVWTNESMIRLERRPEFGNRLIMTEDEVKALEVPRTWKVAARVAGQARTSFITSTPDGLVPPMKPGAAPDPRLFTLGPDLKITDQPETQGIDDRCLIAVGSLAGPVMLPLPNNARYEILQTKDAVAIDVEMIHDVRIVRLNAKHRTDGVRPWLGDSIGHWEGDTLVVETINFPQLQIFRGSWINLKVTERFTPVGPGRLLYRFTVEDPTKWDKPWGGEYEFRPSPGPIEEYACHEGEEMVQHTMESARFEEQAK